MCLTMPQLFVHRLTVIDFSYLHAQRGLVGESWQVNLELQGQLDDQGMLLDFGEVKKTVKRLIDQEFDHKLLVPLRDPGLQYQTDGNTLALSFRTRDHASLRHTSPTQAVTLIDCNEIRTDTLAPAIIALLQAHLPANVLGVSIELYPEHTDDAYYHYSHGLKQHCGNCQRIAHGHRSRLRIERNGQRDRQLEQQWAERWRDIYIGTRSDICAQDEQQISFQYTSAQGVFSLSLPASRCYLIDTDSTVENIAVHLAGQLKRHYPADQFRVMAFEGVDKGAFGQA